MDEVWERAVEAALDGQKDLSSARSLTLDGAVKCVHGRLPPPSLLEKFEQLKQLSIANVGVSSLADFPRLTHLQKLILSDNRIAGGLEFLVEAGLESLRDLDLSNNKIQYIDDLAPLAQLKLVSLDLYECPVTRVVDYRAKVFGMIKSLKYLDKADAEDNERPESDEEEDDDDDEEDDGGSGEVDGEERCGKLDTGPPEEEDEEEDEDGDESEEDEEEGTRFIGNNLLYSNNNHVRSNGFGHGSVFDSNGLKVDEDDEDSSSADEEDVEDEDDGKAERFLRLAVDASRGFQAASINNQVNVESSSDDEEIDDDEDEEEDDVENVEVQEVEESEDDEGDEDEDDDEDDEGEEEEDIEEDEDENTQPSSGPVPINSVNVPEGGIDDHESDDEDENGELGEEDEFAGEEEVEYEEEDVEEEEDDEDNGTEYLVQPVPVPAHLPSNVPVSAPVLAAEDEEEASDFEVGLDDEDVDEDEDEDVEEEDDEEHEQKQIESSKRKRDQDDDTDDSDDEDDEDERPNKKR